MAASKAARPEVHAPRASIAALSVSPREHIRRPSSHRTAHVRPHPLRAHACACVHARAAAPRGTDSLSAHSAAP
eukprot:3194543-Prymnesium_polylepis.2